MSYEIVRRTFAVAVSDAPVFEARGRRWTLTALEITYAHDRVWWNGTLTIVKKDGTLGETRKTIGRYDLADTATFKLIDEITVALRPRS